MARERDPDRRRTRRVDSREGEVVDAGAVGEAWGAGVGLHRERAEPPPGARVGPPDRDQEYAASASLAGERSEPAEEAAAPEPEEWGAASSLPRERGGPPPKRRKRGKA